MAEQSEYEKQTGLRNDWWRFVVAVGRHGHSLITFFGGFGILWLLEKLGFPIPPWAVPWIAAISVVIGAFIAWRHERAEKNSALITIEEATKIPDVTGSWKRTTDPLIMLIASTPEGIKSDFQYDGVKHELKAYWDRKIKKFVHVTFRTDTKLANSLPTTMNGTIEPYKEGILILTFDTDGTGDLPSSFHEVAYLKPQQH